MTIERASGLVPMHIGLAEPGTPAAGPRPRPTYGWSERPLQEHSSLVIGNQIDWARHGVQPRWLGQESGDCAVALEPGIYHNSGDIERKRFLAGAAERGETALLVSTIGDVNGESRSNPLATRDASVKMPLISPSIGGPRLLAGSRPKLAEDLDSADFDLGKRLLNRPADAAWWSLEVHARYVETGSGQSLPQQLPSGHLHPILVDIHGAPVVAAWIPDGEDQRWYILPDATDWNTVIDWLITHALPLHAPGALRRVRHATYIDLDLQTAHESRARESLAGLEAEYAARKAALEGELRHAEEHATPVRDGMLYGTGGELVAAVARVLSDAGLAVQDVDLMLGKPESADLLVTCGAERRLVEVKSEGGRASEKLVDALRKHLETWPALKRDLPVGGGVLIVNHQHRLPPQERAVVVYERKAFVASLPFPVLSTVQLFTWWRAEDWQALRGAIFGSTECEAAAGEPGRAVSNTAQPIETPRRRRWRRGSSK